MGIREDLIGNYVHELGVLFELSQKLEGDRKGEIFQTPEFVQLAQVVRVTHPGASNNQILRYLIVLYSYKIGCT